MVEVRRVGILSLALMSALLYGIIGLIIGIIFACVSIIGTASFAAMMEETTGLGGGGIIFGILYAICMPILYAAMGFVFGAIAGFLYNIIAGIIGGIKIELNDADLAKGP
jgi:hypothetical protein